MRHLLLKILLLGSVISLISAASIKQRVVEKASGHFEWQIHSLESIDVTVTASGIEYSGWGTTIDTHGHTIPVLSKLIYTSNGPPIIEAVVKGIKTIQVIDNGNVAVETAKGIDLTVSPDVFTSGYMNTKLISTMGPYQLWAINVYGVVYNSEINRYEAPDELILTIKGGSRSATQTIENDLYLNHIANASPNAIESNRGGLGQGKFKLYVLTDGIYRIYYDSLKLVQDFPLDEIRSQTITLSSRSEQKPLYVHDGGDGLFDDGDYFDFIGIRNYSSSTSQYFDPFTDLSIYWLDWGETIGLRFIEESGALESSEPVRPTSFWDHIHVEKDSIFDRLGQVDTDLPTITRDHYFWNSVNSGQHEDVYFQIRDPFRGSSENVNISIGLHGLTYSQNAGEEAGHTLFAFMNDYSVGEGNWSQQEEYTLVSPAGLNLSHNILANGNNKLSIFAPVSTEAGNYDRIVLNWIEIGYEHLLNAHNDALRFRKSYINPATNLEFEIKAFSSPYLVLYKEGLSKITGYDIRKNWDSQVAQYSLVFQDQVTDATPDYWSSTVESLLAPIKIIADTSASLRESDGDFIVITTPEFMGGLEDYLQFKTDEGWNPIAVSIADIYDEFNYGVNSPYAIKSFLKYANNYWPSAPEYVILIGDAISDPQSTKQDTRIRNIPTFYMQTYGWGAAEADYWFSLLNGDDYLPDVNIGRIPCSDQEDLEISLEKLIRYGSGENYGSWQNELIMIAGFESTFKTQSEALLQNSVPLDFQPSRIFIDRDSEGQIFWGDTDSLIAQWNSGKLLINFLGHGGGAVWADRSLFVRDDINYLDPDTPPAFVASMTCFTASFSQTRGLGEVVLTESPAGAIGWFGSSGVGWVINDYLMIQPLLRRLLEEHKTVGELINIARIEYYLANSGYDYLKPSMLFQYNFLGDPTTRLAIPESSDLLSTQKSIYTRTDQLHFSYTGEESGTLELLPINGLGQPWQSSSSSYNTDFAQQYLLNQEESPPDGESRTIYTLDRGSHTPAQHGYVSYSISNDWFEHHPPSAAELVVSDIIPLRVQYHSSQFIPDSMVVNISGDLSASYNLNLINDWWELSDTVRLDAGSGNTYYSFSAYSEGLFIQLSPTYRLYLPDDISLIVNGIAEGVEENLCGWVIDYTLHGTASGTARLDHQETGLIFSQDVTMDASIREGNNTLFIPSFLGTGPVQLVTSLSLLGDIDTSDNNFSGSLTSTYFQILPGLGLTFDGHTTDTLSLWSNGYLSSTTVDTSWIRIKSYQDPILQQSGITFYADSVKYEIQSSTSELDIDISSPLPLFMKNTDLNSWQILYHSGQSFNLKHPGVIAMGQKQDFTGPDVSMMMEGQLFFDGDYLLESSRINLLAEDENGFTWDAQDVQVLVDATPIDIQIGDTTETGRIISIAADLDLEIGDHDISYMVRDALGNWSKEVLVNGTVATHAEIIDYGNFPNPFEGETLIIYELTQPLLDVVIEIFTLSGYKIHIIDSFNAHVSHPIGAIGYHEIPWNGRDRHEDFVANGVYFYRIKGDLDGEDLMGSVGKMVKNR